MVSTDFPEPAFQWQHHWDEAVSQAKQKNLPMLVVFSASWCPPCQAMKRNVWPDQRVGEAVQAGYVPLYIDVDETEHAPYVAKYQVNSIPYIVVLDQDGRVQRSGYSMSKKEMLQFLAAR